ncbi:MAG: protein kinase [Desulfobacterales bacterium]|nr:protein kinase [Desulfobacterales bacterium]
MLLKENDIVKGKNSTYQVQNKIGSESTFGAVFKALDENGDPVVIKQLLGPTHISQNVGMDYDYVRKTFERESRILLEHDNPRIVKAYDFVEQDDDLFLAMEFINGEDLDQVLFRHMDENNNLPFTEEETVPVGIEICSAIHSIHQLPGQILYRDMKPRNVMWDARNQQIKIIDFGTARFMEQGKNATVALGTEGYSPPEFYSRHTPLSFASDVYTIGATLYELVTGDVPDAQQTPNHFCGQDNKLSDDFKKIIQKAMQQEQSKRYQTAEEMATALTKLPFARKTLKIQSAITNPYPYLSCFCMTCGAQPKSNKSVFCTQCGGKIHVTVLKIIPAGPDAQPMDLFLDKKKNMIGRLDMDTQIYPDIDLSRYDPECYVSRQHCVLKRDKTRFFLSSLKTTNTTKINGAELPSEKTAEINNRDKITLANLKVVFEIKPCVS